MNQLKSLLFAASAVALAGCASTKELTLNQPVGPAPQTGIAPAQEGFIQVYSARERAVVDPNMAEFRMNNDLGKNDFLYEPAHTAYTIYTANGEVLKQVANARDMNDSQPSVVALPPGFYKVEALAEVNGSTCKVDFPVTVEGGRSTVAHLDGVWRRPGQFDPHEVVRLPDGQIVGWRAPTAPSVARSSS